MVFVKARRVSELGKRLGKTEKIMIEQEKKGKEKTKFPLKEINRRIKDRTSKRKTKERKNYRLFWSEKK